MSMQSRFLNGICRFLYRKESKIFHSPCDIKKVQTEYLIKLMKQNANTSYGKKYGFGSIHGYEDYVKKVPLTTYADYESYINAIAEGQKNVLTAEDIRLFELTSGSMGGKKYIPYTNQLKKEFQKGIKP